MLRSVVVPNQKAQTGCIARKMIQSSPTLAMPTTPKQFEDAYSLGSYLNEGASSVVKMATRKKDGQVFAVKIAKTTDPEKIFAMVKECRMLQKLSHPSIIRAHEMFIDEDLQKNYMVLDCFHGRTLKSAIHKYNGHVPEHLIISVMKNILAALEYLHSKGIVHRDLTPMNVLVSDDLSQVKIIDFNVSKCFRGCNTHTTSKDSENYLLLNGMITPTGTLCYSSPEMVTGEPYSEKVDLWAAGLLLFEMVYGFNPFTGRSNEAAVIKSIIEDEFNFDEEDNKRPVNILAKDLMRHLLVKNPFKRYSAAEALHHPWLNKVTASLLEPKLRKHSSEIALAGRKIISADTSKELNAANTGSLVGFNKGLFDQGKSPNISGGVLNTPSRGLKPPVKYVSTKRHNSLRASAIDLDNPEELLTKDSYEYESLELETSDTMDCSSARRRAMEMTKIYIHSTRNYSEMLHLLSFSQQSLDEINSIKRDRGRSVDMKYPSRFHFSLTKLH